MWFFIIKSLLEIQRYQLSLTEILAEKKKAETAKKQAEICQHEQMFKELHVRRTQANIVNVGVVPVQSSNIQSSSAMPNHSNQSVTPNLSQTNISHGTLASQPPPNVTPDLGQTNSSHGMCTLSPQYPASVPSDSNLIVIPPLDSHTRSPQSSFNVNTCTSGSSNSDLIELSVQRDTNFQLSLETSPQSTNTSSNSSDSQIHSTESTSYLGLLRESTGDVLECSNCIVRSQQLENLNLYIHSLESDVQYWRTECSRFKSLLGTSILHKIVLLFIIAPLEIFICTCHILC